MIITSDIRKQAQLKGLCVYFPFFPLLWKCQVTCWHDTFAAISQWWDLFTCKSNSVQQSTAPTPTPPSNLLGTNSHALCSHTGDFGRCVLRAFITSSKMQAGNHRVIQNHNPITSCEASSTDTSPCILQYK